jgi:anti-sigma B factor antagonist
MPHEPLLIEERPGTRDGVHILKLSGPLVLTNLFDFQAKIRADDSNRMVLDFTNVPLIDSAGVGALVGAYVSREKTGRTLALVAVNQRIKSVLDVTRVLSFFKLFDTVEDAEAAALPHRLMH